MTLTIGLTGGIGSGKSAVADLFAAKGVPVIDADIIAKELTQPRQPALAAIIKHFGSIILQIDGTLDRRKLRDIIFAQPSDRLWLEALLHPLILERMRAQISALKEPYCIAVIPLLTEISPCSFIDRVLVVDTSQENQVKRVAARDRIRHEQVVAILQSQASREQRLAVADDIITNNAGLPELAAQVAELHQHYSQTIKK